MPDLRAVPRLQLTGGMHHLLMDPEHGNGTKFIQVLLTAFASVPTLLTISPFPHHWNSPAGCGAAWIVWLDCRAAMGPPDGARDRARLRLAGPTRCGEALWCYSRNNLLKEVLKARHLTITLTSHCKSFRDRHL
jgi:hypothetical protein